MARISEEDYFKITWKTIIPKTKKSKYWNEKVCGYDSKKEMGRAWELKLEQRAWFIYDLKEQEKILLQESFRIPNNKRKQWFDTIRTITYIADFTYRREWENKLYVEDSKWFRTEVYKIKRKMLLRRYKEEIIFIES